MGGRDAIGRVMEIVRAHAGSGPVLTVVSAMAGVTDRLLRLGEDALRGRANRVAAEVASLRRLHEETFSALDDDAEYRDTIARFVAERFGEIEAILHGIGLLGEFSTRTSDRLLGYGEILSSRMLADLLAVRNPRFCHSDARQWIVADLTREGAVVNSDETERRVRRFLRPQLARGRFPVAPGFVCSTTGGEPATLGRNGSDYSAAIAAAALGAREIWIYTDVDGVLTADPSLVAEATVLPQISYQEAAEMSYFGAKVLHPKTMIPAVARGIPIRIKNTFHPAAPGTVITRTSARRPVVKTVTSVRDLALLNVEGNGMVGIPGVAARLFDALAREDINILMVSQSSSEHSICLVIRGNDTAAAVAAIRREFQLEIERRLIEKVAVTERVATVSIIGAGMRGSPGISGKFFEALGHHRINVLAIAQGSSELNISAAIQERNYRAAVAAIHTAFGLTRDLHVFVFGCGNVGRTLLRQIQENRRNIGRTLGVELKVLGVANSRSWRFAPAGLSGRELAALGSGAPLDSGEGAARRPATDEIFERIRATYRSDIVLVDATGAEMAPTHIEGMRRGFHIVTANKKPLTTSLADYDEIRRLRRRKGLGYQYEATFGAGLPLLYTLQDLIQTGDRILGIQGCLSGTLGYLCSRLDEGDSFSRALSEAMRLGYTEPDPRDDLSGLDVARKSLIIARELGFRLELRQVKLRPMIPRRFFRLGSVEAFLRELPSFDAEMGRQVEEAHREGKVLRFVADISPEGCVVGLERIGRDTPVGRLAGPDNILVFRTQRYLEHPLVIQGPGAGAGVTAAGVLSDILKIAKSI